MLAALRKTTKKLLSLTPYRIARRGMGNRLQAIEDLLLNIRSHGYRPHLVIDGGANIGEFSRLVKMIWPEARILMVEPQPACEKALRDLQRHGGFEVEMAALGDAPGTLLLAASVHSTSTGAHVTPDRAPGADDTIEVPVVMLPDLIGPRSAASASIMLKLDLQGYELHALRGAGSALDKVDAILTEASFYPQSYEPSIEDLIRYLDARGFALHDIGALYGRRRDGRAHQADLFFVRRDAMLSRDTSWE